MANAPNDLLAVRAVVQKYTGLSAVALGIVPDPAHVEGGGYHCGKGELRGRNDYSIRQLRDIRGLTDSSSAIDFGSFPGLKEFSRELARLCHTGDPRTDCVREVIYSADGRTVSRYDAIGEQTGGSPDHLTHTHCSLWRDTEGDRAGFIAVVEAILGNIRSTTPAAPPWPEEYFKYRPAPRMMHSAGIRTWQRRMHDRGWSIGVDGWYGRQSESVCRQFQREKSLAVDGIVGPITWRAAWTEFVT